MDSRIPLPEVYERSWRWIRDAVLYEQFGSGSVLSKHADAVAEYCKF